MSAMIDYPKRYKITGFEILLNPDIETISRHSYDVLEWLGDMGGMMQGLEWIGLILIGTYYVPSNGNSFVVSQLFSSSSEEFKYKRLWMMIKRRIAERFCFSEVNMEKHL